MGVAAGLGVLIYLRRPPTGHRVLAFACAAVAAVVLYSGYLCDAVRRRPAGLDLRDEAVLVKEAERLDAACRRSMAYRAVVVGVARDLCARRCTLSEGVERLAATEQAHDGAWLRRFRTFYPGYGNEECLAASLINHVDMELRNAPADRQLTHDLEAEYRALYGREAPPLRDDMAARVPPAARPAPQHVFGVPPRLQ
jgi:hypothetical protein